MYSEYKQANHKYYIIGHSPAISAKYINKQNGYVKQAAAGRARHMAHPR